MLIFLKPYYLTGFSQYEYVSPELYIIHTWKLSPSYSSRNSHKSTLTVCEIPETRTPTNGCIHDDHSDFLCCWAQCRGHSQARCPKSMAGVFHSWKDPSLKVIPVYVNTFLFFSFSFSFSILPSFLPSFSLSLFLSFLSSFEQRRFSLWYDFVSQFKFFVYLLYVCWFEVTKRLVNTIL